MTSTESLLLPLFASTIMPGEYIFTYLARLLYYSPHSLMPRFWQWPSGMRHVLESIPELVGSLDYVKRNCTWLPAITRCLPNERMEAVVGHFENATQLGLMALLGMSGPRTGWAKSLLARCPVCIKEDLAGDGLPFFRREHLLAGIRFCGRHKMPLHVPCERCLDFEAFPAYTRHAGFHCGCGLKPIPGAEALPAHFAALEIEMSQIVTRLLDASYLPHLNHEGIGRLIGARSQELGIVDGNFFRAETAIKVVNDSRFRPLIERTGIVVERSDSAAKLFKGTKVVRSPLGLVALAGAMFPDWADVERRAADAIPEVPRTPLVFRPPEVRAEARQARINWMSRNGERWFKYYAQKYETEHKLHPEKNHMQLMRLLPHGAALYLTEESLKARGYPVPDFRDPVQYYKKLDKSLSLHVKGRKRHIEKTNCKRRGTKTFLVTGHRMASIYANPEILPHLIETRAALAYCEETKAAFKERMGRTRHVH
ncbi:TniQ family protein [Caballeronia sp. ATUFL_M2_KS44]|uniref:TniQ family protein n=1 Tax=Caballeronia sp. ATUFL_M2_KS44 TaxID=2921767 RepID=UPI002027EDD8|nr:TniQ family protein [Caballeronia sp. ATUFL_M2_KS44]